MISVMIGLIVGLIVGLLLEAFKLLHKWIREKKIKSRVPVIEQFKYNFVLYEHMRTAAEKICDYIKEHEKFKPDIIVGNNLGGLITAEVIRRLYDVVKQTTGLIRFAGGKKIRRVPEYIYLPEANGNNGELNILVVDVKLKSGESILQTIDEVEKEYGCKYDLDIRYAIVLLYVGESPRREKAVRDAREWRVRRISLQIDKGLLFSIKLEFQTDLDHENLSEDLREEFDRHGIELSQGANVLVKTRHSEWLIEDKEERLLFSVGLEYQTGLNDENIPDGLRQEFNRNGIYLSENATVPIQKTDSWWRIDDKGSKLVYTVRREAGQLKIYGERKFLINKAENKLKIYRSGIVKVEIKTLEKVYVAYYTDTKPPYVGEDPIGEELRRERGQYEGLRDKAMKRWCRRF